MAKRRRSNDSLPGFVELDQGSSSPIGTPSSSGSGERHVTRRKRSLPKKNKKHHGLSIQDFFNPQGSILKIILMILGIAGVIALIVIFRNEITGFLYMILRWVLICLVIYVLIRLMIRKLFR